jgi:hypothetical protein
MLEGAELSLDEPELEEQMLEDLSWLLGVGSI